MFPRNLSYIEEELALVTRSINDGYITGRLRDEHFTVFWLAYVLGFRKKIMQLTVDDVYLDKAEKHYYLDVEKLKKRFSFKIDIERLRMPPLINDLLEYLIPMCLELEKHSLPIVETIITLLKNNFDINISDNGYFISKFMLFKADLINTNVIYQGEGGQLYWKWDQYFKSLLDNWNVRKDGLPLHKNIFYKLRLVLPSYIRINVLSALKRFNKSKDLIKACVERLVKEEQILISANDYMSFNHMPYIEEVIERWEL